MKIVINPAYGFLEGFIKKVPANFLHEGDIIYQGRNTLKVFECKGVSVCVKAFRKPHFINRIIYSFFRKNKALKAYYNALEVQKRGFDTPESIAYIETYRCGLLADSYYICTRISNVREIREYYYGPLERNKELIAAFAQYSATLHENQIYHQDYSPGNVLIQDEKKKYKFSLVDINRMKFMSVSLKKGCRNFERMFDNDELYVFLAIEYAQARGFDRKECVKYVNLYKNRFLKRNNQKKRQKAILKRIKGRISSFLSHF